MLAAANNRNRPLASTARAQITPDGHIVIDYLFDDGSGPAWVGGVTIARTDFARLCAEFETALAAIFAPAGDEVH